MRMAIATTTVEIKTGLRRAEGVGEQRDTDSDRDERDQEAGDEGADMPADEIGAHMSRREPWRPSITRPATFMTATTAGRSGLDEGAGVRVRRAPARPGALVGGRCHAPRPTRSPPRSAPDTTRP